MAGLYNTSERVLFTIVQSRWLFLIKVSQCAMTLWVLGFTGIVEDLENSFQRIAASEIVRTMCGTGSLLLRLLINQENLGLCIKLADCSVAAVLGEKQDLV